MTIVEWNLLLNVVVSVLAVGYGLWLKKIVDQQLKMKDAVISSLEAVIRTKEAEVSRLGGESAPAVATAYLTMKEFANDLAQQKTELEGRIKEIGAKSQAVEIQLLRSRAEGFQAAQSILSGRLRQMPELFPFKSYSATHLLTVLHLVASDGKTWSDNLVKEITAARAGSGTS